MQNWLSERSSLRIEIWGRPGTIPIAALDYTTVVLDHGKCTLFLARFCKLNVYRYGREDDVRCWVLGIGCGRGGGGVMDSDAGGG